MSGGRILLLSNTQSFRPESLSELHYISFNYHFVPTHALMDNFTSSFQQLIHCKPRSPPSSSLPTRGFHVKIQPNCRASRDSQEEHLFWRGMCESDIRHYVRCDVFQSKTWRDMHQFKLSRLYHCYAFDKIKLNT